MNYYGVTLSDPYLSHHGIKGQKWGVRRFQNEDGSRTSLGKKKRKELTDEERAERNRKIAKGVKIAVGAAAIAGVAYYASQHPEKMVELATKGKDALKKSSGVLMNNAKKAVKEIEKLTVEVGKETYKAGLAAFGVIQIRRLTENLSLPDDASQDQKDWNYVLTEAGTAGIKKATSAGSTNNSSGNKNKSSKVGKETSDKWKNALNGEEPKGGTYDNKEWSQLMSGKTDEQKQRLRSAKSLGYSIEQIKQLDSSGALYHSGTFGRYWCIKIM